MENEELMVFELIASSLIRELYDVIISIRLKYKASNGSAKRKEILKDLFQVKDKSELQNYNFDKVNLNTLVYINFRVDYTWLT